MLVTRWQAAIVPDIKQITAVFQAEGLEPFEESLDHGSVIGDHRHPFDEVRMVASGQMLVDISGEQAAPKSRRQDCYSIQHQTLKKSGRPSCLCLYLCLQDLLSTR
ncbi:MAG: hypothetical protein IPJ71_13555 [Bdellovibrionales bacterium]|nr:hypothetical protein [Bdellovibrionales bacterium]